MDERVVKFRVGVMVLSTLIIAAIMVLLFGDMKSVVEGSYTIYIHFPAAPGVTDGTPVHKNGILIGRVTHVELDDDYRGGVTVTVKIRSEVKLPRRDVARITHNLLGDAEIQFMRGDENRPVKTNNDNTPPPPGTQLQSGDDPGVAFVLCGYQAVAQGPQHAPEDFIPPESTIEGTVQNNPLQVISDIQGDLGQAISTITTAGTEITKLAQNLNSALGSNDESINRIVHKTEDALDTFQVALKNINSVIGDPKIREDLARSIEEMPELLKQSRGAVTGIQSAVEALDRNLQNMEGFTGPLGERGASIIARVDQTIARMDDALSELATFGESLNQQEGTFGEFLKNPELYQRLNRAAGNIEQITCQLKPIVRDARAFSDKIARHPELLGVRGALKGSSGIK